MGIYEIYDLLADNWNSVRRLPLRFGLNLINHLKEKEIEYKVWQMWLMRYQNMDKENFISFEDFLKKIYNKNISKRSAEEILEESRRIQEAIKRKKEGRK